MEKRENKCKRTITYNLYFFFPPTGASCFWELTVFCFIFHNLFPPLFQFLCRLLSDRDRFQLGTLSHSLNSKATGYQELSDWPAVAPDPSVRNVEVIEPVRTLSSQCTLLSTRLKTFYHACKHNVPLICSCEMHPLSLSLLMELQHLIVYLPENESGTRNDIKLMPNFWYVAAMILNWPKLWPVVKESCFSL